MRTKPMKQSESVDDFLKSIIDVQSGWQQPRLPLYIWRGVGDIQRHTLVPTALRPDRRRQLLTCADMTGQSALTHLDENQYQVLLELRVVERFLMIADQTGLALPSLPWSRREALSLFVTEVQQQQMSSLLKSWPPRDLVPLLALLQHHGLPTRLLDWTYNPLTAAYFAAESAKRLMRENPQSNPMENCLGVWIAAAHDLPLARQMDEQTGEVLLGIEIGSPPNHQNPNLSAQSGVFTWLTGQKAKEKKVAATPLDRVGNSILTETQNWNDDRIPTFSYFSLPWACAEELLVKLFNLGVSRASLMPGYDGVVKCMEEIGDSSWSPQ